MKLENVKGTRDIPPEDMLIRQSITGSLKEVFERYGYSPLETPVMELQEVLDAKGGAGQDADATKETYRFTDQGSRKIGLRFELTLSLARYVGMNPTLKMPFKRYEMGPVFRDGPIKLGRYRQFWQCDVDAIGSSSMLLDAELLCLSLDAFDEVGLDAYLEVNNRKILKGIIAWAQIEESKADSAMIIIDKLKKFGKEGVLQELAEKGIPQDSSNRLIEIFSIEGKNEKKIAALRKILVSGVGKEGLDELESALAFVPKKSKARIAFNPSLARGLAYYTGTIFEGFAKGSQITSSICGGGRYDKMIGSLLGGEREYPAVGISFGLDVLTDVLKLTGQKPILKTTQAYVIPIKTQKECFEICQELRRKGINAEMDVLERGISKNLEYANAYSIPFCIIAGARELAEGKVTLKDMASGSEQSMPLGEAVKAIKSRARRGD